MSLAIKNDRRNTGGSHRRTQGVHLTFTQECSVPVPRPVLVEQVKKGDLSSQIIGKSTPFAKSVHHLNNAEELLKIGDRARARRTANKAVVWAEKITAGFPTENVDVNPSTRNIFELITLGNAKLVAHHQIRLSNFFHRLEIAKKY